MLAEAQPQPQQPSPPVAIGDIVPAVCTEGLTKDFGGGRGVFDLDLAVRRGEIFGFIGPNGAGKTTTIKLLLDLIRADRGRATLLGLDSRRDSVEIKRQVGYVPGELPQYPSMRGAEIIELLARLRGGVDPGAVQETADRLQLDLSHSYEDYSHGNKQKLMLIQAFMHHPDLLILDEPTLGLDPLMQQEFFAMVQERAAAGGTVFLSSHVLSEVQRVSHRVCILGGGRVLRMGPLEELRELRVHRVEALCALPIPISRLSSLPGVEQCEVSDHTLRCNVHGEFAPLLAELNRCRVLELDSEEMSLEEVFLGYYRSSSP